jgi:hypothetical protein
VKRLAFCLSACALLAGCNGLPQPFISDPVYSQYFVVNSGFPAPFMFQGSAIQWNDDYAVTAKHIPYVSGVVHEGQGDLVFFKHRSTRKPEWRQYTDGERLTAVGFSPFLLSLKGSGHAKSSRVTLSDFNDGVRYSFGDMPVVKGMSGGPVFADDGKVVGITVAFVPKERFIHCKNPEVAASERVSVFISYEEISKEWELYQRGSATAESR